MSHEERPQPWMSWQQWINTVAEVLEVDAQFADVELIHELTKHVAHSYDRPMAPVSSFLLGLAVGLDEHESGAERSARTDDSDSSARRARMRALIDRIYTTLPESAGHKSTSQYP